MAYLPIDDGPFALGAGVAAQRHQLQRRQDRRQRVPQLVAEHRQELVLGAAGRLLGGAQRVQFVAPLHLVGDIERDDENPLDLSLDVAPRLVDEIEHTAFRSTRRHVGAAPACSLPK